MSRSIDEIYQEIVDEKDSLPALSGLLPANDSVPDLLSDLSSSSKVAIWRLWAYIMAVAIYTHELLFDQVKVDVQAIIDAAPVGTPRWYQSEVLKFQLGDSLQYLNNRFQYNIIDESKQIVKYCAVEESNGQVLIKTAKDDSGNIVPLTASEVNSLSSYVAKIKFAGTFVLVSSYPADELDISFNIYYDPIRRLSNVQDGVQAAIDSFRKNLPFNGRVSITAFTDAVQAVEGVVDPIFVSATATPDVGSPVNFDREYFPLAGYISYADTVENMFNFIESVQQ